MSSSESPAATWPIAPSKYDGSIVSVKVFQVRYGFAWSVWRGDGTEPGSLLGAAGSYKDFDRAWDDARECFAKQVAK